MQNIEQRNEDFLNVVCRIQRQLGSCRPVSVGYAIRRAVSTPAESFYVTREYAYKALHERRRRLPPHEKPHRRQMWEELERALRSRMNQAPRETEWEALDWVLVNHRPSGFFITESYAKKLYNRCIERQRSRSKK